MFGDCSAQLDTTTLPNGSYVIDVNGTDDQGNQQDSRTLIAVAGDLHLRQRQPDLQHERARGGDDDDLQHVLGGGHDDQPDRQHHDHHVR